MTKKNGTSRPEMEKRVAEALDYLLCFTPTHTIKQEMMTKYGIKESAVARYVAKARHLLIKRDQANLEDKRNKMLNTLENLYNKAYLSNQYATAHKILQEIALLDSLYPDKTLQLPNRESMVINFAQRSNSEND